MLQTTVNGECIMQKVAFDMEAAKQVSEGAHKAAEEFQRKAYNLNNGDSWLSNLWGNIKASLDRNDLVSGAVTPAAIAAGLGGLYGAFSGYDDAEERRKGRLRKILSGVANGAMIGGTLGIGGGLLRRGLSSDIA